MNAELFHVFDDHAAGIYCLDLGQNGEILTGSADKHVAGWIPEQKQPSGLVVQLQQAVYAVCDLPEHGFLLVGNAHGGFHVIDRKSGTEIRLLNVHRKGVFGFLVLPDNRLLVTGGDGSVSLWSLPDFELLRQIPLSGVKLRLAALWENVIAIPDSAGPIHLLHAADCSPAGTLAGHPRGAACVLHHPGKNVLISGGRDAHLRVWGTRGEALLTVPAHNFSVYGIACNPSGTLLATASFDKTVKVWDAASMEVLLRLERPGFPAHRASVNAIAWLNDRRLVSVGDDRQILVWDIAADATH